MALGVSSHALGPRGAPTVSELIARGERSYSFEFSPPRDAEAEAQLWGAIRRLEGLAPTFVSVTYGAGGSTRDRTVRITRRIAEETTLTPVAHLTCVAATREELRQVVGAYAGGGVRNILALRGDPPGNPGGTFVPTPGGLDRADQLVAMIRGLGDFCIGVAAFPEVHPESPDIEHDDRVLVAKADAGAEFAVTQFFFDADDYFRLRDRVEALGCDMPILPGLMPVTNLGQIERFRQLNGKGLPAELSDRLRSATDAAEVRRIGMASTTALAARLLDDGAPGLHFYTLNRSTATLEIYHTLGLDSASRPTTTVPASGPQ
jgi:methylenetetrahydrofolate reductase (NADPH)